MTNNITSTARLALPAGGFQKRVRLRRVAVTALAVALLAGVAAPEAAAGQDRPELQEAIQAFVDVGFAGMQLRVHDQRGEWVGSAGVRKLGETAKPPTNGRFRIGSNTKTFVATVVLQLVAEGKIGLDAPVADYLPRFGLDRRITVRMLLQHTSGVFNYTGDFYPDGTAVPGIPSTGQEWVDNRFHTYQPEELVRLALSKPAKFAPGTGWSYSNTNYTLAALLIEKVTGRSYADGDAAADPAAARAVGHRGAGRPAGDPRAARPRLLPLPGRRPVEDDRRHPPEPLLVSGAGDMISTTQDLHTFFSALQGGKLLPPRCWPRCASRTRRPATASGCSWRTRAAAAPSSATTAAPSAMGR